MQDSKIELKIEERRIKVDQQINRIVENSENLSYNDVKYYSDLYARSWLNLLPQNETPKGLERIDFVYFLKQIALNELEEIANSSELSPTPLSFEVQGTDYLFSDIFDFRDSSNDLRQMIFGSNIFERVKSQLRFFSPKTPYDFYLLER